MMYVYALGGFVLLFAGGEWLVHGAVSISRRFGLSPLLIGMTVVAWCTSAPEFVVSLEAALSGSSDIAIGNVVGSNIFNVMAVLGVAGLIAPIVVEPCELRRDVSVMLAASVAAALLAQTGEIGRTAGLGLIIAVVLYVVLSYRSELKNPQLPSAELHTHEAEEITTPPSVGRGLLMLGAGLVGLVIGARLLIMGATEIARGFGVPEAVIGLTLVAVGTSLPELAASIMAAVRGHSDVAIGNVVGSNIFNILSILGFASVIHPIGIAEQIARTDVWVMLAVAVLLGVVLLWRGRISRLLAGALLSAYVVYVVVLFV